MTNYLIDLRRKHDESKRRARRAQALGRARRNHEGVTMTENQEKIVKKITLSHLNGVDKDTEPQDIGVIRWDIHDELFEDERLEDVSAVDLVDASDYVISIGGWRL